MKTKRFSREQIAYAAAKALHTIEYQKARDYDKVCDQEGERLGLETPYAILPEGHPMAMEAQLLLDRENAAKDLLYKAAHNLFDWATETTLTKIGTESQKADIRSMVATVKKQAYCETNFEELVDLSMRLKAA